MHPCTEASDINKTNGHNYYQCLVEFMSGCIYVWLSLCLVEYMVSDRVFVLYLCLVMSAFGYVWLHLSGSVCLIVYMSVCVYV